MVQSIRIAYVFDPADPRAPTEEQWAQMTPAERARVVDMLPAKLPIDLFPPEGDLHRKAKDTALNALDGYFQRAGRKVYLSSELAVFYPGEPRFSPDVLAVLDVENHDRMKWVVSDEGKGLDFVLEVYVAGDWAKDHEHNVERYARLGIPEYFIFDRSRLRLQSYRLGPARTYQRIVPQAGRFASHVLGLDLGVEGNGVRFFAGTAPIEDVHERIERLGSMLDEVIAHKEEAYREREAADQLAEEFRAKLAEEQRLRTEEQRLREAAERRLAEALAELARLKKP